MTYAAGDFCLTELILLKWRRTIGCWMACHYFLASIILPRESIMRDHGGTFLEVGPYSWVLCYWACRAGPLLKWGSIAIGLI